MKAEFSTEGIIPVLTVYAENETEQVALILWSELYFRDQKDKAIFVVNIGDRQFVEAKERME